MPNDISDIPIVIDRARYLPPRHPVDSNMGIIDATTMILLQKMMADSYEAGRVVWKENRARCALSGEVESDELPCGPNTAQQKVQTWLVDAGLLDAENDSDSSDEESDENVPPAFAFPPQTRARRPWHRRLEIVIPSRGSPKSPSQSTLGSPRSPLSPLSPLKLWSQVQRSTSSLPLPTLRLKSKHIEPISTPPPTPIATPRTSPRQKCRSLDSAPSPPRPEAFDPGASILANAFRRAALLQSIDTTAVDAIMRRHHTLLPRNHPDATWYVPPRDELPAPVAPTAKPKPKLKRAKTEPEYEPMVYKWPQYIYPLPPSSHSISLPVSPTTSPISARDHFREAPDLRWYHPLVVLGLWYFLLVTFCSYVVLRLVIKPLTLLIVLYYLILLGGLVLSFF
ncbi:hypothetical protein C8R43DRAFT_1190391 [Mycena crocata]|nr:hypothetical protein C8R43DRAFT_1190391 [Mycena crocata]